MGRNAKTDAVDAAVLARMGAALDLRPTEPPSRAMRELADLAAAREGLVADRVAALNRAGNQRVALLKQQCRRRLAQVARQLDAVDAEIAPTLAKDEGLARRAETLASIPGVGRTTAAGLLAAMPELGSLDARGGGQSGRSGARGARVRPVAGKRLIQGGRGRVRRLLYMAAVSAIRHNQDLGRKYRELTARGKPAKAALVAVMRKLLLLANALLRQNRLWTPRSGDESARDQPDTAADAGGPSDLGEGSLGDRSQGPKGQPAALAPSAGCRPRADGRLLPSPT